MVVFCVRYRRNSPAERGNRLGKTWRLEVGWTAATFVLFLGLYFWGADLYIELHRPPDDTMDIHVVAKQWMWKVRASRRAARDRRAARPGRPAGPAGDDVAGRDPQLLRSRLPHQAGRRCPAATTTMWFTPTQAGEYRLFCAEFCGTEHSAYDRQVIVMEPGDYAALARRVRVPGETLGRPRGRRCSAHYGCSGCHGAASTVHAPTLEGLFGRPVPLADGSRGDRRRAATSATRSCCPRHQIAAGYPPSCPPSPGRSGRRIS